MLPGMTDETRVLFNGDCPVCSFEIGHYQTYSADKGLPIRFDDLNGPDLADWGFDPDTAARRLYVLHQGEVTSGVDAFLVLWRQMPRWRWMARVVGLPGIRQAASLTYDHALAPAIYRWHRRRQRRRQSSESSSSRSELRQ
jgi:predicted DCC family thiol-disulfide oxidoreductase YuxK